MMLSPISELVPDLTDNDAAALFADTMPGSPFLYYIGFLARDRDYHKGERSKRIDKLAEYMWGLMRHKKVLLVQRRLGHELYEYYAVRTRTC